MMERGGAQWRPTETLRMEIDMVVHIRKSDVKRNALCQYYALFRIGTQRVVVVLHK